MVVVFKVFKPIRKTSRHILLFVYSSLSTLGKREK